MNEEHLLAPCDGLDRHKIIDDNVTPNSIFTKAQVIGPFLACLLPTEDPHDSARLFCKYGKRAVEVRIGVFAYAQKGRLTRVDDKGLAVVYP